MCFIHTADTEPFWKTFGVYEDEEGVHVDASKVVASTVLIDPTANPFGNLKLQQVEPISMVTTRDIYGILLFVR